MIVFKPYAHLVKIGKAKFRLTVIVQMYDGYDIRHPQIHYLNGASKVQVNLPVISCPGQIHTAPREIHVTLENVPKGFKIETFVSTYMTSSSLPKAIRSLALDITKKPIVFGKVVLCTDGAEKGKDDREGDGEDRKSNPPIGG